MAMLQLDPPIPLTTPKGEGFAHILIDYGPETDPYWTVFITRTGEVWTYSNPEVRATRNITLGRTQPDSPPQDPRSTPADRSGPPKAAVPGGQ
ncbi:hypothetical protein [Rhodanobacter lindaniclasticus]|nr:hypothetical protein [Rhodanobacter lindaniclasticus]